MPIKRTAELWKEISLNLSPDCSTEHIYFLLRVSALFIRTASCKRNDFPGEKPSLPVVCKLVCFPFAACLPWCASVMESIVKQLELHLGPFWSCCKLQAPVRAEVGGCREELVGPPSSRCWVTLWAAVGAGRAATPRCSSSTWEWSLGHVQRAWVTSSSGEIPSAGQNGRCDGTLGCFRTLPAVGACSGSLPTGKLLSKVHLLFLKMLRLHPEEGFETWQQEALQHPLPVATARVSVQSQGRST